MRPRTATRRPSGRRAGLRLIPNPAYADYTSGHGCVTGSSIQAIRHLLGEGTPLTLHSANVPTDVAYRNLRSIERDALMARIWGGLHFRDAMEDAYTIGHRAADLAVAKLR